MPKQTQYNSYDEVPVLRREKIFWLFVVLFWPIAVFMLTRRIYYPDGDQLGYWEKEDYLLPCIVLGVFIFITILQIIS